MRIGVIRLSSLGDIVLTGPAVRGLRARFPEAELVYITTKPFAPLAAMLPGVDKVEAIDRRGIGFEEGLERLAALDWDRIADLQGSDRGQRIRSACKPDAALVDHPPRVRRALLITTKQPVGRFWPVPMRQLHTLAPWGVEDDLEGLELTPQPEVRETLLKTYPFLANKPFVLMPGAKHETKRWRRRHWVRTAQMLLERGPVVVIGGGDATPDELKDLAAGYKHMHLLDGRTTLAETFELLQCARAAVSVDTGPMHMAVAAGTPIVALFGPTVKEFGFFPFRAKSAVVVQKKMWCRPCSPHGTQTCPLMHHNCMRGIEPEYVVDTVDRVIGPS